MEPHYCRDSHFAAHLFSLTSAAGRAGPERQGHHHAGALRLLRHLRGMVESASSSTTAAKAQRYLSRQRLLLSSRFRFDVRLLPPHVNQSTFAASTTHSTSRTHHQRQTTVFHLRRRGLLRRVADTRIIHPAFNDSIGNTVLALCIFAFLTVRFTKFSASQNRSCGLRIISGGPCFEEILSVSKYGRCVLGSVWLVRAVVGILSIGPVRMTMCV